MFCTYISRLQRGKVLSENSQLDKTNIFLPILNRTCIGIWLEMAPISETASSQKLLHQSMPVLDIFVLAQCFILFISSVGLNDLCYIDQELIKFFQQTSQN